MHEIDDVKRMLHWLFSSQQGDAGQKGVQHAMLKAGGLLRKSSLPLRHLQNLRMTGASREQVRTLGLAGLSLCGASVL